MPRPWLWGVGFGLLVGGAVVFLNALRYGFSPPLLILGMVLVIAFGALALVGAIAGRRTGID
jgi:hypothetical protein